MQICAHLFVVNQSHFIVGDGGDCALLSHSIDSSKARRFHFRDFSFGRHRAVHRVQRIVEPVRPMSQLTELRGFESVREIAWRSSFVAKSARAGVCKSRQAAILLNSMRD